MLNTAVKPIFAAVRQANAIRLRDYQLRLEADIYGAWDAGARNVFAVLPTGGGKTMLFGKILSDHQGAGCAIAHRQELVGQISLALARYGVRHKIIGPQKVVKFVVALHMREVGYSFYDANSSVAVAGVDTLVKRGRQLAHWLPSVTFWVQDEGHHVLRKNKWGKAAEMFPNAKGLMVSATPCRADGKGLGRHADGLADALVEGPTMRDLINLGWLTDYKIFAPPSDMRVDESMISATTGDFSRPKLAAAAKASHIVGDVVAHFKRLAAGKRGVTFVPDVETARRVAEAFNAGGLRAEAVSAKTDDRVRAEAVRRLGAHEVDQLVNVDLFGEGFDLPAIDAVSMARHTASFSLFVQQCGRALRPIYAKGLPLDTPEQRKAAIAAGPKPYAIIIDHVGNVQRHAVARDCPETGRLVIDLCYREWSLDARDKRGGDKPVDAIPLTTCLKCFLPYERVKPACPFCGDKPEPAGRSAPEFVDGDLLELDPEALTKIFAEIKRIDAAPRYPQGVGQAATASIYKNHVARQAAQKGLRDAIAWWAGYQRAAGRSDAESYRRFWFMFGVDVATAQTLNAKDAGELADKIFIKLAETL